MLHNIVMYMYVFLLIDADVDRSVWWHYLVIMIPDKIQITDTAFLYITGGSNTDKYVFY